jgi:carboxymethylenebutenolidase
MAMRQAVIDLYDEYASTSMPRRQFLERLTQLAGSAAAAATLLAVLEPGGAVAVAAEDDDSLTTSYVEYPGASGTMRAYWARPEGEEKLPGIVVIHENRGLNAHIEDVARRAAREGFVALAPDALSPLGGAPEDQDKARSMIGELDPIKTRDDFVAAVTFLKNHPETTEKVGCVGFCWGGRMANQLAVHARDLSAAVAYYGSPPASEDVPKIEVPLLLHYAGLDERINQGVPAFEEALKANGVRYTMYMYEGAAHAFNNDTGDRYNEEAAKLAWKRTVAFWNEVLKE